MIKPMAQPARHLDDSQPRQRPRRDATVLPLPRRPEPAPVEDEDYSNVEPASPTQAPARARTPLSVPGDFASITAVWNGSPEPLAALVGNVTSRLGPDRTPADIGMAGWAVIVLPFRAVCSLLSWTAQHPARFLVAVVLGGALVLILAT